MVLSRSRTGAATRAAPSNFIRVVSMRGTTPWSWSADITPMGDVHADRKDEPSQKVQVTRPGNGLAPGAGVQLLHHLLHVGLHRVEAHDQRGGDVLVRRTGGEQAQHLHLAGR